MSDDQLRISEFMKALRKPSQEGIIDLDETYLHKFNFQIHRFEDVLKGSTRPSPPNRWSYFRIGLITRGQGELITGTHKIVAVKNTLVVIPPRMITSSSGWTSDTKGYVLLFNLNFFVENNFSTQLMTPKKLLSSFIRPDFHLTDDETLEFRVLFEYILAEKNAGPPINQELIALKIMELIILGERVYNENYALEDTPQSNETMRQFIGLLDQYFCKEHSVSFYASQLALHPNHLNALVKKHTGLSAKESIQNRLLLEIKYMLHSTPLSVKEIASQLGFSGQNYFATFFKRLENLSPAQYRAAYV